MKETGTVESQCVWTCCEASVICKDEMQASRRKGEVSRMRSLHVPEVGASIVLCLAMTFLAEILSKRFCLSVGLRITGPVLPSRRSLLAHPSELESLSYEQSCSLVNADVPNL